MPIGLSDGQVFKDEFELLVAHNRPLEASEKPAGALNEEGSYPSSGQNQEETKKPLRVVITPKSEQDLSSGQPDPNQIGQTDVLSGEDRYQLWPEKMVRNWMNNLSTKWEGLKAVMDGKIDPLSDEGRTVIASVATELGGAGLATSPMRTGVGTFGGYLGVKNIAETTPVGPKAFEQMSKARHRLLGGEDPQKVFEETGFFFDPRDSRFKFEVVDKDAKLIKKPATGTVDHSTGNVTDGNYLEEVFTHPTLFKVYPELRRIKIFVDKNLPPDIAGGFLSKRAAAELGIDLDTEFIVLSDNFADPNKYDTMKTLLHEIQHWIQEKEGFGLGGKPNKSENIINEIERNIAWSQYTDLLQKGVDNLTQAEKKKLEELRLRVVSVEIEDILDEEEAVRRYYELPGEMESRNVETRYIMDKLGFFKHRRTLPNKTESVPKFP